jgi:predicted DNA-binding protein (MmcQ/YjbR family)
MRTDDPVLKKMKGICLSLPDTKLTMTWDKPHFRVGDKIFAGCGEEEGRYVLGFKLEMEHAGDILRDRRFTRAPYVGHKGWVSMDATGIKDWEEVRTLVLESYRLIAPKRTLAKLEAPAEPAPKRAKTGKRKS